MPNWGKGAHKSPTTAPTDATHIKNTPIELQYGGGGGINKKLKKVNQKNLYQCSGNMLFQCFDQYFFF